MKAARLTHNDAAQVLIRYKAVRNALAELVRIDEVKDLRDQAIAIEVYAYQARDAQLAADAVEIKKRAIRRIGELMEDQRKVGMLAKGTRGQLKGRRSGGVTKTPPEKNAATLAEQRVDKNLARQARRLARLSDAEFERDIAKAQRLAVAAIEGDRAFVAEHRAERNREKKARRAERERELAKATERAAAVLGRKIYSVVYVDPPWRYNNPPMGDVARANEQHYPTMEAADICALKVPAAENCALFLWGTIPMLPQALEVMEAWGFRYKSAIAWFKDKAGTGYWVRGQCELLLIGTRGEMPAPAPGEQPPAVIEAPRGRHSEKPAIFAEMIERLFPNSAKLEMFARVARPGWDVWGNEVGEAE
jgi:N6-adenosine-specific RNA methylase IME4